jgi:hypothetical protein
LLLLFSTLLVPSVGNASLTYLEPHLHLTLTKAQLLSTLRIFNPHYLSKAMDSIDRSFLAAVNHLVDLYNDDMLDECAEGAEELIQDYAMPLYHRMKVLILLANVQVGWEPAEGYLVRAEAVWRFIRRANPKGADATTDKYLAEIRDLLDELRRDIEEQKFEEMEWDHDDTMEDSVVDEQQKLDDEIADARARLEGINFDADISNPDPMQLDVKEGNRSATPDIANDPAVQPDALTQGEPSPPTVPGSGVNMQIIF